MLVQNELVRTTSLHKYKKLRIGLHKKNSNACSPILQTRDQMLLKYPSQCIILQLLLHDPLPVDIIMLYLVYTLYNVHVALFKPKFVFFFCLSLWILQFTFYITANRVFL